MRNVCLCVWKLSPCKETKLKSQILAFPSKKIRETLWNSENLDVS